MALFWPCYLAIVELGSDNANLKKFLPYFTVFYEYYFYTSHQLAAFIYVKTVKYMPIADGRKINNFAGPPITIKLITNFTSLNEGIYSTSRQGMQLVAHLLFSEYNLMTIDFVVYGFQRPIPYDR
jgi:hypothetical protein